MDQGIVAIRGVACIMVVVLHVASKYFYEYPAHWGATNVYDSLVRGSVPLFFMISGALLLPRTESTGAFLRKRLGKVLLPLLFWSGVYLVWNGSDWPAPLSSLWAVLTGPVMYHLWFLYALVGLYLFMPFLSKIYKACSPAEHAGFLALWFVVGTVMPVLQEAMKLPWNPVNLYYLNPFGGYVGYLLLGAVLHQRRETWAARLPVWGWALLFIAMGGATAALTAWYARTTGSPKELFFSTMSPTVALSAVCAFLDLSRLSWSPTGWLHKLLAQISACSLGIYGLHAGVVERLVMEGAPYRAGINHWLWIPLVSLATLVLSLLVCAPMRKIPGLRAVV